jgi:hypothetical protein
MRHRETAPAELGQEFLRAQVVAWLEAASRQFSY